MTDNIDTLATPRANDPHAREVGPFVVLSGTSARQQDNAVSGVDGDRLGAMTLDVRVQGRAILDQIVTVLRGLDLDIDIDMVDFVSMTTYLVNMNDFAGYNEVWNGDFPSGGPVKTTVEVRAPSRADRALEMRAVACRGPKE
ncbi:RidA family protein [Rhodococcus qingshengii]|uniref:2-aminomuconate deaminase n=1 Tax=Rhodococcus qingshengii TaxID=334542 RepID=A0A2A5IXS4_RHOSG|nr:RidA family protein [Rhodococcus qingshengii]PCK22053.1 hypothetical protein CHR55_33170 [Rhodococcus qingshengii]